MRRWPGLLILLLLWQPLAAGELEQKQAQLQQLQQRISALKGDLGESRQRRKALLDELRNSERAIGESGRRLYRLDLQMQKLQRQLRQLRDQQQQQQAALAGQRGALRKQLRAAYVMGRQERLKILLNQQDPAVVSRVLVYYDYFNRARLQRMEHITRLLEELAGTERQIASRQADLQQTRSRIARTREQLELGQQLRQQVLSELQRQIRDKGAEIAALQQNERQLQGLLKRLQQQSLDLPLEGDAGAPFRSRKGRLAWPTKGRLKVRFGSTKVGALKWDGVIISAPEGQEVRAVHHGRVAFADWLRGFGLLLIIDHGDGYMTLYGHNQSLYKETGEWVEAGEPIARVGSSGGLRTSGLYFGIRYKGRPVNPQRWARVRSGNRVGLQRSDHTGQGPTGVPHAEASRS